MWVILQEHISNMPGWCGYISMTGDPPKRLTTIGYYPVIHHPITENKTVAECLDMAEKASHEVGQDYIITTFDMGVCMKAYPLIWNEPDRYNKHIILIGTFHLTCVYFRVIGKKMDGSGLSDILLEAGIVGSGTVYGVLSGKNYSRAMVCHKIVLEALERRFLIHNGEKEHFENIRAMSKDKLKDVSISVTKATIECNSNDADILAYIDKYSVFKDEVRNGKHGKTSQFWLQYMDQVWLTLKLHEAVKRNDFMLYEECIRLLPNLFFSFDGQNYARYLTMLSAQISNLDNTHQGSRQLLNQGAFSVARSMLPACRTDVDKTMEETLMRQSKSHGGASGAGISGITRNNAAYQRWVLTTHERSQYLAATFQIADMMPDSNTAHRDLSKAEIKRNQMYVDKTVQAFCNFINPFDIDIDQSTYLPVLLFLFISKQIFSMLRTEERKLGKTSRMTDWRKGRHFSNQ